MQFAFLVMSCAILLSALFGAFFFLKNPSKRLLLIIAGFFISGVLLFIPLFNAKHDILSSIVFSSIQSMQMYLLNSSFNDMTDNIAPPIRLFYNFFLGLLHIFAPLLLATAILSLITDKVNLLKCHIPLKSKYIFSEINNKSVALAISIKKNKPGALIVFSNTQPLDESSSILMEAVKENHFILVNKPMDLIYKISKTCKSEFHYFAISDHDSSNLENLFQLIERNPENAKIFYYVFTNDSKSEILLDKVKAGNRNIKLIHENQTTAYELLKDNPLYKGVEETGLAPAVLILGLGDVGTEILKAMLWCATSGVYTPSFMILDKNIAERIGHFKRNCPALSFDKYNIRYHHENMDFNSHLLHEFILKNELKYNYIVLTTGDDDLNINTALGLRGLYRRSGKSPVINVMVEDEQRYSIYNKYLNTDREFYFFGCHRALYTHDVILEDALDKMAMVVHQVYSDVDRGGRKVTFSKEIIRRAWNGLSSVEKRSNKALALYFKYRMWEQGCTYAEDRPESPKLDYVRDVLKDDLIRFARLEHERWNAYMLTEGWVPMRLDEAVSLNKIKITEQKRHACITEWENVVRIDELFHQHFIDYDKNFILKTEDILNSYNAGFGHHFKIIRICQSRTDFR